MLPPGDIPLTILQRKAEDEEFSPAEDQPCSPSTISATDLQSRATTLVDIHSTNILQGWYAQSFIHAYIGYTHIMRAASCSYYSRVDQNV